ncbi:MAG: ABC transporter ATP-binding protein [Oliverpabstia sp.]
MHKREKQQWRVLALIQRLDRGLLPIAIVKSILEAAIPYLNILLPSFIVNLLYKKVSPVQILLCIIQFYMIVLGVQLLLQFLKKHSENKRNKILNSYAVKKIKKIFYVKYQFLETAAFEKIRQGIRYNDENFGAFKNYMDELEKIYKSVFQVLIAIGIFVWIISNVKEIIAVRQLIIVICGILSGILLSVILMLLIQRAVNQHMPVLMDKIVDVNTLFSVLYEDVVQNYRKGKDIRLFGMDRLIVREGEKMVDSFAPYARKQIWLSQVSGMAGSILSLLIAGISFVAIGRYALEGYIAPGNVISFVGSIQQLSSAVIGIAFSLGSLNLWNVRMESVFQLFDMEEDSPETYRICTEEIPSLEKIEFQDVSFRYPEGKEDILKHVSLTIRKGEKIAVVGPNGSGKSTFIKILTGLYAPTSGRILINGQDRTNMDQQTFQTYMAAVYQDFMMFSFTLKENIVLGGKENREEIADVFERLKMTDKVKKMKNGIDTWLYHDYGEEGQELSGGEAQKLAICRALYKDAPVVVLDEPTAALDPVAEYKIYKDFQMLVEEKTAVFVSHRLSSCRFCQNIFVFENGMIVQQGSHEKLLEDIEGLYRKLWDVQAQYYVTE